VSEGEDANLVVFDPLMSWTARNEDLHSHAVNSPYDGRTMTGRCGPRSPRARSW